ncbi:sensor histidine kinase [Saccharomonospora piscinae]|uniref:sensor histidine kinase n=1 Tax=Saccharomonospora piscinae TaxID=687388 RepID=UPI000463EEB3|nr:sensor histidine kinase [Saccharomonospora piscinae]
MAQVNDDEPDWSRWRRPRPTARQRRNDVWVALGVMAGALFTIVVVNSMGALAFGTAPSLGEQLLWGAAVTAPLVVRRRFPLVVLFAVGALFILAQAHQIGDNFVPSLALFLAIYSVGAWERSRVVARWARVGVIVAMFCWLGVALAALLLDPGQFPAVGGPLDPVLSAVLYNLGFNLMFFLSAYFFGEMAWLAARREAELEYRADQLRRSQEENTRGALVSERVRIARDLHDVVAHHVSVMGIQAGAARRVLDTDIDLARTALDTVETTARTAIGELRGLLGVLRAEPVDRDRAAGSDGAEHVASPGLDQLPELVERAASPELAATFAVFGEPYRVSEGVALSVYRVVQEALTNAVKHAAARTVEVRLRYLGTGIEVDVTDDGRGPSGPGREPGSGLGLLGMRERVAVHGGELETGPRRDAGYRVRARFPHPAGSAER